MHPGRGVNLQGIMRKTTFSRLFHVKYVGCKMIVSSTISPAKAIEISNEIARKGPKMNKRQVSLILTPEEIFVKDTIHQCGLANFQKGDIEAVFSMPHDPRLLGVAIKDDKTPCCIIYIYKCSVKHFECKGSDIVKVYEDIISTSTLTTTVTSTSSATTPTSATALIPSSITSNHSTSPATATSTNTSNATSITPVTLPHATSLTSCTYSAISYSATSLCCSHSTHSLTHEQSSLSFHSSISSLASRSSWYCTLSKLPFSVTSNYDLKNNKSNLTCTFSSSCPALTLTQHTTSLFLQPTSVYSSHESSLATHSSWSSSETLFRVTSFPELHRIQSPSYVSTRSYSSPTLSLPPSTTTPALSRNILPSPYIFYRYESSSFPTRQGQNNQDVKQVGSLWASTCDSNINSVFSPENNGLSHYASHDQLPSSPRGYMEYDFVSNKRTETAVYNSYCTLDIDDNDYSISGESINMPTIITSPEIQDKTDDGVDDEDSGNQSAPQRSSPSDHTYSYLFGSSRNTTQDMEHVHGAFRPPRRISPYIEMMIKKLQSSLDESAGIQEGSETESEYPDEY